MSDVVAGSIFGSTERVFVYDRGTATNHNFVVRPAVVVVDGNQIRFRNFTDFPIRISADFFTARSVDLERKGGTDRKTVTLVPNPEPGFREYLVEVNVNGTTVEARGESRPGAIIDR
jgi:hypothetical protein